MTGVPGSDNGSLWGHKWSLGAKNDAGATAMCVKSALLRAVIVVTAFALRTLLLLM